MKKIRGLVVLLALCISIGFALISTQLNIFGETVVKRNNWDIYFDNITKIDGTVSTNNLSINTNKTTANISVVLPEPGDYYEFTIDCVNAGSLNAIIDDIEMTNVNDLDPKIAKVLNYQVLYPLLSRFGPCRACPRYGFLFLR